MNDIIWTPFRQDFRSVAENAPSMIWMTSPDGYCFYLNPAWTQFTGQSSENGAGAGWVEMVHPDDQRRAECAFHKAVGISEPYEVEYRLKHRKNGYRWVSAVGHPYWSEDGVNEGYIGWVVATAIRETTPDEPPRLSPREMEALELVAEGKTSQDIAVLLSVSPRTVEFYINSAMVKLNAINRTHAVVLAIRCGQLAL